MSKNEQNKQIEGRCPICGGFHPPGACPKEERVLSPEEKKEQEELQKELENYLSEGWIFGVKIIIALAKEKKIPLDFTSACQKGLENCLSEGRISVVKIIIALAEKKNIRLDFSKPEIVSACQKGLEKRLSGGWISDAEIIIALAEEENIPLDLTSA